MGLKENYEIALIKFEAGKKIRKIKTISLIFIILILGISLTSIFLINNKNMGFILSGTSDNFIYEESMIIKTNNYYYFTFGNIKENKKNVISINKITLYSDDRLIISSSHLLTGIQTEKIGYNEFFPDKVYKNINNWYYKIEYTDKNNQIKEEILKLEARKMD